MSINKSTHSDLQEWLHRMHAGNAPAELQAADQEGDLRDLSLRDVLQAHKDWRVQLEMDVESERLRTLEPATIARDDLCTLGQWLHGPGRERFGGTAGYAAACQAHREFHRCAGEMLRGRRNNLDAEALTNLSYQLRDASSRNQLELVRLFTAAHS